MSQVLVINSGSSSLKFKLFETLGKKLVAVSSGLVERIGDTANSRLKAKCFSPDPTAPEGADPLKDPLIAADVLDEKARFREPLCPALAPRRSSFYM